VVSGQCHDVSHQASGTPLIVEPYRSSAGTVTRKILRANFWQKHSAAAEPSGGFSRHWQVWPGATFSCLLAHPTINGTQSNHDTSAYPIAGAVQRIQFESELIHVGDYEYPGGIIITYHISNSSWLLTPIGIAVQCRVQGNTNDPQYGFVLSRNRNLRGNSLSRSDNPRR
jgi:hypothetical protein